MDWQIKLLRNKLEECRGYIVTMRGSAKHDAIHAAYEKKSDMSTEERHAFYSEFKGSRDWGNSAEELVEAGIITQEQADRMNRGIEK